jgi:hypothetical protein
MRLYIIKYYLDGFSGTFISKLVNTQDLLSINLNKIFTFFFIVVQYIVLSPFNIQLISLLILCVFEILLVLFETVEIAPLSRSTIPMLNNLIGDTLLVYSFNES